MRAVLAAGALAALAALCLLRRDARALLAPAPAAPARGRAAVAALRVEVAGRRDFDRAWQLAGAAGAPGPVFASRAAGRGRARPPPSAAGIAGVAALVAACGVAGAAAEPSAAGPGEGDGSARDLDGFEVFEFSDDVLSGGPEAPDASAAEITGDLASRWAALDAVEDAKPKAKTKVDSELAGEVLAAINDVTEEMRSDAQLEKIRAKGQAELEDLRARLEVERSQVSAELSSSAATRVSEELRERMKSYDEQLDELVAEQARDREKLMVNIEELTRGKEKLKELEGDMPGSGPFRLGRETPATGAVFLACITSGGAALNEAFRLVLGADADGLTLALNAALSFACLVVYTKKKGFWEDWGLK